MPESLLLMERMWVASPSRRFPEIVLAFTLVPPRPKTFPRALEEVNPPLWAAVTFPVTITVLVPVADESRTAALLPALVIPELMVIARLVVPPAPLTRRVIPFEPPRRSELPVPMLLLELLLEIVAATRVPEVTDTAPVNELFVPDRFQMPLPVLIRAKPLVAPPLLIAPETSLPVFVFVPFKDKV